jgi:hypothetical protein
MSEDLDILGRLRKYEHMDTLKKKAADEIELLREDRDRWKDLAVKLLEAHSRILDNE